MYKYCTSTHAYHCTNKVQATLKQTIKQIAIQIGEVPPDHQYWTHLCESPSCELQDVSIKIPNILLELVKDQILCKGGFLL